MFAPKVARPQTKATSSSTVDGAPLRSPFAYRTGQPGVDMVLFHQPPTDNRETVRLPPQCAAGPNGKDPVGNPRQEVDPENSTAPKGVHRGAWNFSKIALVSPDRASRPRSLSSFAATPHVHPVQARLVVGQIDDPLENEADRIADQAMQISDASLEAAHHDAAIAPGTRPSPPQSLQTKVDAPTEPYGIEAPTIVHEVLRTTGQPLTPSTRAFFEPRLAHDFSTVQVHADRKAARSAAAIGARAYAAGPHIVFGSGEYGPGTERTDRLIAHELVHVVQQSIRGADAAPLRRQASTLGSGEALIVEIRSRPGEAPDPLYSKTYPISLQGTIAIDDGTNRFEVVVKGLAPKAAAERIAAEFVRQKLFAAPTVSVSTRNMAAPAGATAPVNKFGEAYSNFLSYIKIVKEPPDAVARYYQWLNEHRDSPELLSITPPDLWRRSLQTPERPMDPHARKVDEYLRFIRARQQADGKLPDPKEKARAVETMSRFQKWFDANQASKDFEKADLAARYAQLSVDVLKGDIDTSVAKEIEKQHQAAENSPERMAARSKKFDEFMSVAMDLWGYSARTFPYRIPIDSEGKDILVTGDPATQLVLNAMARELMNWATGHMFDAGFLNANPKAVLVDLLKGGYSEKLAQAAKSPLRNQMIDRNELLPGKALAAFGGTVATGLLVVAIAAAFVGAEVITAGQATWILVAIAGAGGVKAFVDRYQEVEKTNYSVPIPETMLYSAGDVVGVSQLIEGISGQRLGTNVPLGSEARSQQIGAGAGAVATMLVGSKAYRTGEQFGTGFRVPKSGLKPAGPNAAADVKLPEATVPPRPVPPAKPGPKEAALRSKLPEAAKIGFDRWMAEIRAGNKADPEKVVGSMSEDRARAVAENYARKHASEEALGAEAERARTRAKDDPLRPILRNVERKGNITIHYETKPPTDAEIAHAQQIQRVTGEPVHLFGDTANGVTYPGIDGTIGSPPRPLSLKTHSVGANAESARFAAQEALAAAKQHGYTQVELDISMPAKTVAEIKAGWERGPTRPGDHPLAPYYEGSVVAKITIRCSDGVWVPPKGPALTGVVAPPLTGTGGTPPERKPAPPGGPQGGP